MIVTRVLVFVRTINYSLLLLSFFSIFFCLCYGHKGYDISHLAGMPGAVGGAIYGNAGAYGLKIKDILHSCTIYDRTSIHTVSAADMKLGCRTSSLKDGICSGIFLTATFSGLAPRER